MRAGTPQQTERQIENRVGRFGTEQGLWAAGDRVLVATSGGPDSSALLAILSRLAERADLQLVAAYFDHGLRGAEAAAAERSAVERLAAACGVPLVTGFSNVARQAREEHRSLEDAARRARYAFLARAAAEQGCRSVATGHTATDQAETVLLHVVRGAGLRGAAGIAPRSAWPFPGAPSLNLVRPLLALGRAETEAYCRARGLITATDASNETLDYTRNRIRHQVLPLLRQINPGVDAALERLADAARIDLEYIESVAATAVLLSDAEAGLDLEKLLAWPVSLRRHALQSAVARVLGDRQELGQRHVDALERLAQRGRTGDSLDLPRGLRARRERSRLVLAREGAAAPAALPECPVQLPVPGEVRFGHLLIVAAAFPARAGTTAVELDAGAVGTGVTVRRRRPGDRMHPAGLTGTKKLQDILVDAHVPRAARDAVPVFENARGILWAGGVRAAEWARPRAGAPTVTLAYRSASADDPP